jgi:hypothetical protein
MGLKEKKETAVVCMGEMEREMESMQQWRGCSQIREESTFLALRGAPQRKRPTTWRPGYGGTRAERRVLAALLTQLAFLSFPTVWDSAITWHCYR